MSVLERLADRPQGRYIDVTAITPTPLGEGKTVTTVGLGPGAQAHRQERRSPASASRRSGPVFGIKGGAAGGGYSQVVPMEDFNLHLTGDVHAVTMANNLLAAYIDNHIYHGNELDIDPHSITWRRVVDLNDRALRNVVIGLGGKLDGVPRETGFDISVASEVMAILALATDLHGPARAARPHRHRHEHARASRSPPSDLKCAGAMAVLMKDAIKPNLLQNLEGGAVFVHAGPFANIAQGNNSIIADQIALKLADYVVTESGFGADMGAEKFMNIKCRASGLTPDCVVIVATVRALKAALGPVRGHAGQAARRAPQAEDLESLAEGIANLEKHIENMKKFGVPVVVAVNHFPTDTDAEHDFITRARAGGGRGLRGHPQGARGRRRRRRRTRRGGRRGVRAAQARSSCSTRTTRRSRRRSRPSPPRSTAPTAWTTCPRPRPRSSSTPSSATATCRCAWPRRTSRSRTTRRSRAARPAGVCRSATSARASARASSTRCAATCARCPDCPKTPAGDAIDLDENGNVVGLF